MLRTKYDFMDSQNAKLVLTEVISNGSISRSQIARNLKINKVTISQVINKLIAEKLLVEIGAGTSTTHGGRKPSLVSLNYEFGFLVSVDIAYQNVQLMTSLSDGQRFAIEKIEIPTNDIQDVLQTINDYLTRMMQTMKCPLISLGLSIHGVVKDNQILYSPFVDYQQLDLKQYFENKYQVPVILENEANLTAIYERDYEANNDISLISISIHKGIGAGIIIAGHLYKGRNGEAGEIGHSVTYANPDVPIVQENKVENYCSETALIDRIKQVKNVYSLNLDNIKDMYRHQDDDVLKILHEFCGYMSKIIYNTIISFDPDKVVLNATILEKIPELKDDIIERVHSLISDKTPIYLSSDVLTATLYASASLQVRQLFQLGTLKIDFRK